MQAYGEAPVVPTRIKLATIMKNATDRLAARAWATNSSLTRWWGRFRGSWMTQSENFAKMPLHVGAVSPRTLAALQDALIDAPIAPFDPADHAAGYVFNSDGDSVEKIFKAGFKFRKLGEQQSSAIAGAVKELAPNISALLGTGWRVINVKSWSIQSETVKLGPNAWHLDGFPIGTFKLMVYLTPISSTVGTTEVKFDDESTRLLEGDAGTFLLFDPSTLLHRGVAPTDRTTSRVHVEITLMRALTTDVQLAHGGLNSAFPRFPWTRLPKI